MLNVNMVEPLPRDRWSSALASRAAGADLQHLIPRVPASSFGVQQQQPGHGGGSNSIRRHVNESDYEEIGPPPKASNILTSSAASTSQVMTSPSIMQPRRSDACDLCGTSAAFVRCGSCSDQIFCLACDDMYHRHPKRSTHARKAIGDTTGATGVAASGGPIRPPLPPKGESGANGPVAPPRKNLMRKGSAPDSPLTSRPTMIREQPMMSRSSTLPRKVGSMVGRPLPPPPHHPQPLNTRSSFSHHQQQSQSHAPPALPAKIPTQFYPQQPNMGNNVARKLSTSSQPPMHLNYPPKPPGMMQAAMAQPEIPMPGFPSAAAAQQPMSRSMMTNMDTLQRMSTAPGSNMPPSTFQGGYNPEGDMGYPGNGPRRMSSGIESQQQQQQQHHHPWTPYHEEMQFPRQPSMTNGFSRDDDNMSMGNGHHSSSRRRMAPNQRSKFFKLNKSSSMHDIAHEESAGRINSSNDMGGISWMDQPWSTTQSTMNQPTVNIAELLEQQRNFRRASSTKSLHQSTQPTNEMWSHTGMWDPSSTPVQQQHQHHQMPPMMNPMFNPMVFGMGTAPITAGGQGHNSLHRSMHELRMGATGGPPHFSAAASARGASPTNSQKSKKSTKSERFLNRSNKLSRRNQHASAVDEQPSPHQQPASRPHSRSNSRSHSTHRMRNYHGGNSSSRGHSRRRSMSSEDDMDEEVDRMDSDGANDFEDEDEVEDDDDEDFFTGESDNDFVSLSSGSNSKRAPRKSWTCEHCTYVNNPGVAVCVMCCRTSKQSRGEELATMMNERASSRSSNRASKKKQKASGGGGGGRGGGRNKYESSEEDDQERGGGQKAPRGGGGRLSSNSGRNSSGTGSKTNSLKRRSNKNRKQHAKSPMPEYNVSDLEQDAINEYYAVRHMDNGKRSMESEGRYNESSSETSSLHNSNPLRKPNLDAPAPAKGILKKSNSNPHLTKIEHEKGGSKKMNAGGDVGPPAKVVDIKKYLAQTQNNPNLISRVENGERDFANDIWQQEKANWMRHHSNSSPSSRSTAANAAPENDYMSDVASNSSTTPNVGRMMTRSVSGHSLADLEYLQQLEQQSKQQPRRTSEVGVSSGKKNFRSKRFSRNMEREPRDPALRRAHSLHMDRNRFEEDDGFLETHRGTIRKASSSTKNSSGSSGAEDGTLHFTATVQGSTQPEAIGSYLARQEFGSNEGQPIGDSGYVSHGSGERNPYPKMQLPSQTPMESFTMSVDRGYLGRTPGDRESNICRSMDDLTIQKAKGLELVRLLREAEQSGLTAEDVQVALNHCGDANPVAWLKENWGNMMETVMTLASNVGHEAEENTIGTLSMLEAKDALRKHKGNIWAAVTECVEQRQLKYDQLCAKGSFSREDIVTVLTAHQGNVDAAFQELNKVQLKPFLMRIWGQGESGEVTSGQVPNLDAGATDDNNVADPTANEVTQAKHKDDEATSSVTKQVASNSDNDKKKNNGGIAEARENYKFDREVRRLLAEGRILSYEKGEVVVKLKEQEFTEEEALIAIEHCDDLYTATKFLRQECELCTNIMNVTEIMSLPNCEHKCCKDCASKHFTILVKDKNINEATCPFCQEPKGLNDDDDLATNYFAKLDVLLKPIVDQDVHDLFQRKLRDRTLMKDPNFKWCYKCSSGFIADPRNKKLVCPDCRAMSCAKCLLPWETTHEGISCEDFAVWKEANDPDNQAKGVEQHLAEHGIQCPNCKFRYALTKGGCMHFTCTQCKFEFCIGCERPFKMGVKCGKGPACAKMGLHAHHPRHCLFYLRDKEPTDLQRLLRTNKVDYTTEVPAEFQGQTLVRCRVQMQKETAEGLEDGVCNEIAPKDYAGYCKVHYTEYLCSLVFRSNVDPVSLLELGELKQVFARANHFMPKQRPGEYEFQYKKRLAQLVSTEVPLENA